MFLSRAVEDESSTVELLSLLETHGANSKENFKSVGRVGSNAVHNVYQLIQHHLCHCRRYDLRVILHALCQVLPLSRRTSPVTSKG